MDFDQKIFSWNWCIWFHEFFVGLDFFKFSGILNWEVQIFFLTRYISIRSQKISSFLLFTSQKGARAGSPALNYAEIFFLKLDQKCECQYKKPIKVLPDLYTPAPPNKSLHNPRLVLETPISPKTTREVLKRPTPKYDENGHSRTMPITPQQTR